MEVLFAFEIDPYPQKASLTDVFSTNCLQMTQSQQMLKAYVLIGLNNSFQKAKREFSFFEFMHKSKTNFIPSLLSKKADDNFLIIRTIKKIYKKEAKAIEIGL